MSIYLSISKMYLHFRGEIKLARVKLNAKRRPTTQSWDAAIYIEGTRLTFELAR